MAGNNTIRMRINETLMRAAWGLKVIYPEIMIAL